MSEKVTKRNLRWRKIFAVKKYLSYVPKFIRHFSQTKIIPGYYKQLKRFVFKPLYFLAFFSCLDHYMHMGNMFIGNALEGLYSYCLSRTNMNNKMVKKKIEGFKSKNQLLKNSENKILYHLKKSHFFSVLL